MIRPTRRKSIKQTIIKASQFTRVKWIIFTRTIKTATWPIHMTWLMLTLLSGLIGFSIGYGPNWYR